MSPLYLPICGILSLFLANLHVPSLIFKINFSFVCSYRLIGGEGWLIFSMLDVLFSWWVFIHLSLNKKVWGNRDAQSWNAKKWIYFMLSNNKFLGKCWYGGHPCIRLAMASESMVEKGINFISVWEPPMIYLAWKVLGILGHFRWREKYASQNILSLNLSFEL